MKQLFLFDIHECICTRVCDCQDPERGLSSNECPEHNFYQQPHPECNAEKHWWQNSCNLVEDLLY
jgi:hypothetical protein